MHAFEPMTKQKVQIGSIWALNLTWCVELQVQQDLCALLLQEKVLEVPQKQPAEEVLFLDLQECS